MEAVDIYILMIWNINIGIIAFSANQIRIINGIKAIMVRLKISGYQVIPYSSLEE